MHIENIVIGKPLVPLWMLLGENENDKSWQEVTVFEEERSLAKIFVKHGIVKSMSEVRRNRPDLLPSLKDLDCKEIKLGKKRFFLIVGVETEEEYNKIIEETADRYFKVLTPKGNLSTIFTFNKSEEWNIDVMTILYEEKGLTVIEITEEEYNDLLI